MKEKVDKRIEDLVNKMMKETSLETPSPDFTSNIMSQIEIIAQSDVTTYKPLISKPIWVGLFAIIIGVIAYSLFGTTTESNWLASVDLNVITDNKFTNALSGLNFSKTIVYAVVLFALMFTVQIPILKGYFNRRLEI